jgi:hypothetical protein
MTSHRLTKAELVALLTKTQAANKKLMKEVKALTEYIKSSEKTITEATESTIVAIDAATAQDADRRATELRHSEELAGVMKAIEALRSEVLKPK